MNSPRREMLIESANEVFSQQAPYSALPAWTRPDDALHTYGGLSQLLQPGAHAKMDLLRGFDGPYNVPPTRSNLLVASERSY